MFRIPYDPSSGSVEHASLKLLVIFLCAQSLFGSVVFVDCNMKRNVKFVRYDSKIANLGNN